MSLFKNPILLLITVLCMVGCKKVDLTKYDKETLTLSKTTLPNGDVQLKWDEVASSEFVQYEVYADTTPNIDIDKPNKLVATIKDYSTNTFIVPEIQGNIGISSGPLYYRVACKLDLRKLSSASISVPRQILYVSPQNQVALILPDFDLALTVNTLGGNQNTEVVNLNNGTIKKIQWPFNYNSPSAGLSKLNFLNSLIKGGTTANGTKIISECAQNSINIYDADFNFMKTIYAPSLQNIASCWVHNGKAICVGQSTSTFYDAAVVVDLESGLQCSSELDLSYLGSSFSDLHILPSATGNRILVYSGSSSLRSVILGFDAASCTFSVEGLNGYMSATFEGYLCMAADGNRVFDPETGKIYDKTLQNYTVINGQTSNLFSSTASFAENGNKIYRTHGATNNVEIFDANSRELVSSLSIIKGTNATSFLSGHRIFTFGNQKVAITGSIFDTQSGSQFHYIKILN